MKLNGLADLEYFKSAILVSFKFYHSINIYNCKSENVSIIGNKDPTVELEFYHTFHRYYSSDNVNYINLTIDGFTKYKDLISSLKPTNIVDYVRNSDSKILISINGIESSHDLSGYKISRYLNKSIEHIGDGPSK